MQRRRPAFAVLGVEVRAPFGEEFNHLRAARKRSVMQWGRARLIDRPYVCAVVKEQTRDRDESFQGSIVKQESFTGIGSAVKKNRDHVGLSAKHGILQLLCR